MRQDLSLLAAALVPRLAVEIGVDAVFGDEFEAGVDVGWANKAARRLPREHLHDRVEALQVRLLVDHEIEKAVMHRLQRAGQHVVAAGANTFGGKIVFAADEAAIHRVAAAGAEHPLHVLVAEIIGVDLRQRLVSGRSGGDHCRLDIGARFLDRIHCAVKAGLQVQLPRCRDEYRDLAFADQLDDAFAHHLAGQKQILPDIGEALVGVRIGIVAEHRDAGRERVFDRPVETPRVDEAHRDRIGLAGNRGVHRVDHLRHVGRLRAGPLIVAAEQRTGDARDVDEDGKTAEVEAEELDELRALTQVESTQVAPDHQSNRVHTPGAALLVDARHVLRRMLGNRPDDRQVQAAPAAAQGLDSRLQVLDEVPGGEVADLA